MYQKSAGLTWYNVSHRQVLRVIGNPLVQARRSSGITHTRLLEATTDLFMCTVYVHVHVSSLSSSLVCMVALFNMNIVL